MTADTPTQALLITDEQLADLLAGYDHAPGAVVFARRVLPRLQDVRDAYELQLADVHRRLEDALRKQAAYIALERFQYGQRRKYMLLVEQIEQHYRNKPCSDALLGFAEGAWLLVEELDDLRARLVRTWQPVGAEEPNIKCRDGMNVMVHGANICIGYADSDDAMCAMLPPDYAICRRTVEVQP
jgi:hypothetical protein